MRAKPDWLKLAGKFIVFDGLDGCGKTTQLDLLQARLIAAGVAVVRMREPGSTRVGEHIRELLLSSKGDDLTMRTEMLLYMASRAQMVQESLKPALAGGNCVLSDRYTSSTLAYQGSAGGLPEEEILTVARIATQNIQPDLTIILDLPTEKAADRMTAKTSGQRRQPGLFQDRIEQRDLAYHAAVRDGFLQQVAKFPQRYTQISAIGTRSAIEATVVTRLVDFFGLS